MSRPSLTHQSPGRPAPRPLCFHSCSSGKPDWRRNWRSMKGNSNTLDTLGSPVRHGTCPPCLPHSSGPTGGISQHQGSRLDSAHGLKMHHVRFSFAPSQSSGSAYVLHRALSRPSRHTLPGISPRNVLARWTSICIGVKPAICENPKYEHMPSPSALSSRSTGGHCPSLYSWYGTLADWYAMRTRTDPGSSGCLLAQPVLSTAP